MPELTSRRIVSQVNPLTRAVVSLLFVLTATIVGSPELLGVFFALSVVSILFATSLGPIGLAARLIPFFVMGLGFLWMNLLFLRSGRLEAGAMAGLVLVLRALVFGGFSILFVTDLDHESFAASLVRFLRVPPRIVYATLIAFRLGPILAEDRRSIAVALASRGVPASRRPRDRVAAWARQATGLFVAALRRASRIAVAFEARGLDNGPRSYHTPPAFHFRDAVFVAVYLLLLLLLLALFQWSPWSGTFSSL